MAQFRAEIQGARGRASRLGTKQSGMWAHVRGWDIGVRIDIMHRDGRDIIMVYKTGGSTNPSPQYSKPIATLIEGEEEREHDDECYRNCPHGNDPDACRIGHGCWCTTEDA